MTAPPATPRYSRRLAEIEPFKAMDLLARAQTLAAEGRDILRLEIGEPGFTTAQPIIDAGMAALRAGETHYTPAWGLWPLREAIAGYYADHHGVRINPERILITPGATGALLLVAALCVDPGQNVLMTDPGYPCNPNFIRLMEGRAKRVATGPESHYQFTEALARDAWDADTAGILVGSPANPTGEVVPRAELAALAALCAERGGHLLVDEIYHGLTYGGVDVPSALEISDDAFVINSFSKFFGMTGWRIGWLVAPEAAIPDLIKLAQTFYLAPPTVAQHAAVAALEPATLAILEQRRQAFEQRRDFLLPALRELGFRIDHAPAGAFYLYANVESLTDDSEQFCWWLLEEHGIACTPGTDFSQRAGKHHVRFAYTAEMPVLERAVARLRQALASR